jgi:hypothetical protein
MQKIQLHGGYEAIVDDVDFEKVSRLKWYLHTGYAARNSPENQLDWPKIIFMHSMILPPPKGYVVDHINGNRLDNRRKNLRLITQHQNIFNRRSNVSYCSSKYKGVFWIKDKQLWRSSIKLNGKTTNLGYFQTEEAAASAYNYYASKLFGDFARLNEVSVKSNWWKDRAFLRKNATGYRGVTEQRPGRWQARITISGKRISLGYFESPEEAAFAFNEASIMYLGEKALLNQFK